MKEIATKKVFLKKLEKGLRFKYSKDDISSILRDYNEFFEIEIAQGKSESEVCIGLGDPVVIVKNLNLEMKLENISSKKVFLRKGISQGVSIAFMCIIIVSILYKLGNGLLIDLLVSFPVITLLFWIVLKDEGYASRKALGGKNDLWKIVGGHLSCFFVTVFLFIFLNKGVLVLNLKPQQVGNFVVGILYLFIAILCGIILFSTYQFKKNSIAYYSVICHALGVLAITLYYIDILRSLANLHIYYLNVMKSGFIYLESIAIIALFFMLTYIRGYANESTT